MKAIKKCTENPHFASFRNSAEMGCFIAVSTNFGFTKEELIELQGV